MNSCDACNQDDSKCIRDRCIKCCECGRDLTIKKKPKTMKLYVDYCPRCPRPATENRSYGHGPQRPDQCHSCSPESFTDKLGVYVDLDHDIEKLRQEILERQAGVTFCNKRRKELYDELKKHVEKGGTRVIPLGGVTVVLDWTGESMRILFARPERDPDA